jgi:hypothetical protein
MADPKYAVESLTVELLLSPNSVAFKVPAFQRNYAWGAEEVNQFIDDLYYDQFWLNDTTSNELPYFLGSIVLAKKDDSSLILDGQQRLTTISLLLIVLHQKLNHLKFEDASEIKKFLASGKIGQRKKPKIELQPSDSDIYRTLLRLENSNYSAVDVRYKKHNLAHAIIKINDRLSEYAKTSNGSSDIETFRGMLEKLLYGVEFVIITSPSESDAFKLFEALNDRGLALNAADLIKNKLFAQCGRVEISDAIEAWNNMVEAVGDREIVNFLRFFWIATKGFVRKRGLYDAYRQYLEKLNAADSGLFASKLEEQAKEFQQIIRPNSDNNSLWDAEVIKGLKRLLRYGAKSCRSVLLACAIYRRDDLSKLVEACETITIRYSTVGEKNPNLLENMYSDLCTKMRKNPLSSSKSVRFEDLIKGSDLVKEIPRDKEFKELFAKVELNKVSPTWREVLVKINSVLSTGETEIADAQKVHVEHILPQKSRAKTLSEARLSSEEASELIGRIGNLTLLSGRKNRKISNKPFSLKKSSFESSEIALNRQIDTQAEWGRSQIENRSEELADLAVQAYRWLYDKDE